MSYKEVTLENLSGGALVDMFDVELKKVLANIADENTKPDGVRELKISLKIKPAKDRETAATELQVVSKLVPIVPKESMLMFSSDGTTVKAFGSDPQQEHLNLEENPQVIGGNFNGR